MATIDVTMARAERELERLERLEQLFNAQIQGRDRSGLLI